MHEYDEFFYERSNWHLRSERERERMDRDGLMLSQQWWQDLNQTTLLSSILSTLILFHLFKLTRRSRLNLPPSPPKLPIIGNFHQVRANLHRCLQSLSDKYGPVVLLHLGNTPLLIVSSAEIARDILKSHDGFLYRPQTTAAKALFYGCCDVAFCSFGDYWRQVRKICVLELLSQRRVQAFRFIREEEVANMVEKIRLSSLNGATVNLTKMFATISSSIIMKSALGRVQQGEGNKNFIDLSRSAMELLGGYFCFKDTFPFLGWMDNLTGLASNLKRTSGELHSLIDEKIEERTVLMTVDDKSDRKDFLDILRDLQKDGRLEIDLTRENIKAILLDMFVGGTDTTATTMEWAMSELVKNPRMMRKAQNEVRRVVGEKSKVEESDINKMEYLKCIVKETLRLHAPAMISRATMASTKLEGYDIPPKTTVLINAWAIQRDAKLWDRPEEFIPDRFANISVDFIGQHSNFIPFGAGRRGCPGISLATVEAEYVLASLLYWFDWELPDGAEGEDLDMNDVYESLIRRKIPLCLVPVLSMRSIN